MSEAARETYCDWTVTGMDCGSCATKIRDAVARLPGVSGVEVGIMTERLRLTLDETQTKRDKIEKTVRALGYQIAPRAAGAKKDFVLPGAHDGHDDDHAAHEGHDHAGHDHGHDQCELPVEVEQVAQQGHQGKAVTRNPQQGLHQQRGAGLHLVNNRIRQRAGALPCEQAHFCR